MSHGWQSEPIDGPKSGWNVDLSIYPSIHQSFYLSIHPCVCLSAHLSIYFLIYSFIYLPILLVVCLLLCLSIYLSIYLPFHPSPYLSISLCSRLSIKLPVYVSICLPIESKAADDIVSRTGVGLQKHTKFFYWEMNRVRKDTVGCFHLRSGCSGPLPRVCLCIHIIIPPIITNRRHTTKSNIHTYTTIMLTDMSVPPYITGYINNSKT